MKLAKKNDIWFHVKNHGGSHVILLNDEIKELDQIPDRTIEEAASLAAFYSQEQKSSKVSVDYTFKKNIKKHPNGKPGMVTFEGYFTLVIDPDNSVKQID
jgi:predicted ribosome quality control (RQC) complex YloA/Tae2 family protein